MHAITIWQPMAHAIVHLGKTTENRPGMQGWRSTVGRTVAIHAARPATWSDDHADTVTAITGRRLDRAQLPYSAIIGTAQVTDVHWAETDAVGGDCCDPWGFAGHVHLTLDRARALVEPVPCRGALGAWRLPDHIQRELENAGVW